MSVALPSLQSGHARNASESRNPRLWRGLLGWWEPGIGNQGSRLLDFSRRQHHAPWVNLTGASVVSGRKGRALEYVLANETHCLIGEPESLKPTVQITLAAWIFLTIDQSSNWGRVVSKTNGGTGDNWGLIIRSSGVVDGVSFRVNNTAHNTSGAVPRNVWTLISGTYDGVRAKAYIGGRLLVDDAQTGAITTTGAVAIGALTTALSTRSFNGRIGAVGVWSRALLDPELLYLAGSGSPLDRKRTVVGFVAAAGGTMSGSAAGTSTASGTLTARGSLIGSSAGTSTATGTLMARGLVDGAASGTSTASGTLTGQGALSGTSAGTSTVTGSMTGRGFLVGSTAGTSTASGTLSSQSTLAGTSAGTSTVTGTLSARGYLSGVATGTSTASGTVGSGTMQGSASGTSTSAGTLSGRVQAVGAAAGTSTATGSIVGVGALTGTTAGTSTASGTGTLRGLLRGASAGVATVTGSLSGRAFLVGTSAGTATASGSLIDGQTEFIYTINPTTGGANTGSSLAAQTPGSSLTSQQSGSNLTYG